jgi:hypothetical protein
VATDSAACWDLPCSVEGMNREVGEVPVAREGLDRYVVGPEPARRRPVGDQALEDHLLRGFVGEPPKQHSQLPCVVHPERVPAP